MADERPAKLRRVDSLSETAEVARSERGKALLASLKKLQADAEKVVQAYEEQEAALAQDPVLERLRKVLAEGATVGQPHSLHPDSTVLLNVGGDCRFALRRSTLQSIPQSRLGWTFRQGWDTLLPRDAAGRIFLDFDPAQFRLCVEWVAKVEKLHLEQLLPLFPIRDDVVSLDRVENELAWLCEPVKHSLGIPLYIDESYGETVASLSSEKGFFDVQIECASSHILDEKLTRVLSNLNILREPSKLSLLYRASRDGLTAEAFHERCDGHAPTLTIVKSEGGFIFGGYTQEAWDMFSDLKVNFVTTLFGLAGPGTSEPCETSIHGIRCARGEAALFQATASRPGLRLYAGPDGAMADQTSTPALAEAATVKVVEWEVFKVAEIPFLGAIAKMERELRQTRSAAQSPEEETLLEGLHEICGNVCQWQCTLKAGQLSAQGVKEEERFLRYISGRGSESAEKPEIVTMNVRGYTMMALKSTLQLSEHFAIKLGGRWQVENDSLDGTLIIDQDPELFQFVLRVLRARALPVPNRDEDEVPFQFHRKALFDDLCRYYAVPKLYVPTLHTGILRTEVQIAKITKLLQKVSLRSPTLLYRATRDGFDPSRFHERCDGKSPTLVLIAMVEDESDKTLSIVGGITTAEWDSSNSRKTSKDSTIFYYPQYWAAPYVRSVLQPESAVHCFKDMGPCFGMHDLCVSMEGWNHKAFVELRTSAVYSPHDEWPEHPKLPVCDIEVFSL